MMGIATTELAGLAEGLAALVDGNYGDDTATPVQGEATVATPARDLLA
jgi:eukaryotic-like serine/threonine-protein kinase